MLAPIVIVATCVVFVAPCVTAAARQASPGSSQNYFGVPGCHVTFLLSSDVALTVDVGWLDLAAMAGFVDTSDLRHVCPSQPVKINAVYLSRAVLDVLNIPGTLGRRGWPDWLLHIQASPQSPEELGTFPRVKGGREQVVQASIEMRLAKRIRDYDIDYRSADKTGVGHVKIYCGDDPVNRICVEPGARFAGLTVYYRVSQDQFSAPEKVSTDPSTESGAVLQFDRRLRQWLIGLEHTDR